MARIRTVKPEMAQDEDLAACGIEAQLLAVRLLCCADDEGYFKALPALVKAACFPLVDSVNTHGALTELSNAGYIWVGNGSDGKLYGYVRNFLKHQRINRPTASRIKDLVNITEDSLSDHGGLTGGKERKGKEGKGKSGVLTHTSSTRVDLRFEEWWTNYPKKVEKKKALAIWKRRKLDQLADTIIADTATRSANDPNWIKDGGKFVPNPTTYLNGDRWEDDYGNQESSNERIVGDSTSERFARQAKAYLASQGINEDDEPSSFENDDSIVATYG